MGQLLCPSGPTSCSVRATQSWGPRTMSWDSCRDGECSPSIGNLDQVQLFREKVTDMQRDSPAFCFVPMMSGPATVHHWEESSSVLSALPFGYIYVDEIPLNFISSGMGSPSTASLS